MIKPQKQINCIFYIYLKHLLVQIWSDDVVVGPSWFKVLLWDRMLTWPRGTYDHLRNQRLFQKHVKVTYDPVSIVINNVSISIIISNQKRCRSRESDHLELTNQEAQPVSTPHTGGGASALHAAPVFIQLIDSVKQSFTLLIFKSISETVRTAAVSSSPLSLSLSPPPPSLSH